jgi:hypothetical protein
MMPDLSLAGRYQTVWPALVTRITWALTVGTAHVCALGKPRWLRITTATLLGLVPIILIWAMYLMCVTLFVLWPLGALLMLPTRIAVARNVTQQTAIYVMCWCTLPLFTFPVWWIALIMAFRDPEKRALAVA